jgi:hypothetical protein
VSGKPWELAGAVTIAAVALVFAARAKGWSDTRQPRPSPNLAKPGMQRTALESGPSLGDYRLLERQRQPAPALSSLDERRCPTLGAELGEHSRVLQLTVSDARVEPKQLLPLALTDTVTTRPALAPLEDQLLGAAPLEQARQTLERLRQLRFRGVYRVVDYAEPRLVRKIDKPRPEWLPGVIAASFVVQDLENGQALCQTEPIIVRSDTSSAPIASRQRASTRARLLLALGQSLRERTGPALRRITTELELPD